MVTDVRLDGESTEIHVMVEHPEGCRWNCPLCSRELACYDHTPERQWRHLNTCQFHTLGDARVQERVNDFETPAERIYCRGVAPVCGLAACSLAG
jgi:hypothetical protein